MKEFLKNCEKIKESNAERKAELALEAELINILDETSESYDINTNDYDSDLSRGEVAECIAEDFGEHAKELIENRFVDKFQDYDLAEFATNYMLKDLRDYN